MLKLSSDNVAPGEVLARGVEFLAVGGTQRAIPLPLVLLFPFFACSKGCCHSMAPAILSNSLLLSLVARPGQLSTPRSWSFFFQGAALFLFWTCCFVFDPFGFLCWKSSSGSSSLSTLLRARLQPFGLSAGSVFFLLFVVAPFVIHFSFRAVAVGGSVRLGADSWSTLSCQYSLEESAGLVSMVLMYAVPLRRFLNGQWLTSTFSICSQDLLC